MEISVSKFYGIDVSADCGNWTINANGTHVPKGIDGAPMIQIAAAVNSLTAKHPRVIFSKAWPLTLVANASKDPLCSFKWDELIGVGPSNSSYRVNLYTLPPTNNNSETFAKMHVTNNSDVASLSRTSNSGTCNASELYSEAFSWHRVRANTVTAQGFSTANNARVAAVVVEEVDVSGLGIGYDSTIISDPYIQDSPVALQPMGYAFKQIHELRTKKLGRAFSWCATGEGATPPAPGDQTGIAVNTDSYVNILDQSITNYSETSPGPITDVYRAGIGTEAVEAGIKVKVRCMVRANANSDSYVKFIGPGHVENNFTEILIPANGGLDWYGNSDHYVYLNANATADTLSGNYNKIDTHAKTNANGDSLVVYASYGQIEYENLH